MYTVLVFGMTTNPGGVESFILNYCRYMNKDRIQFDFLCNTHEKVAYEEELRAMGGRVYHISARSKKFLRYRRELTLFFSRYAKRYDAIWVNVCSLANIDYLIWAKKYGISRRIIHSHSAQSMERIGREILHKYFRRILGRYATEYWACSNSAADFFYEGELRRSVKFIPNAIDVEVYSYDDIKREEYRKLLGWEHAFIIGNVGRFHFEKNQSFLLDIFAYVQKQRENARLLLVGQGEDERFLRDKAKQLGMEEFIYFAGVQRDIQGWMSAMDFFVFPSCFEGLGMVALEAQANGLPILASEGVIPREVKLNENFMFYSLERSAEDWAKMIGRMLDKYGRIDLQCILNNFHESKFEVSSAARELENFFLNGQAEA